MFQLVIKYELSDSIEISAEDNQMQTHLEAYEHLHKCKKNTQ